MMKKKYLTDTLVSLLSWLSPLLSLSRSWTQIQTNNTYIYTQWEILVRIRDDEEQQQSKLYKTNTDSETYLVTV